MRIPGVGGSALTVNALASGPERALRKRELKDRRISDAIGLGLRGVDVAGGLGAQIYGLASRNRNEALDRALAERLQGQRQTFQREQAGYEHGLGAPERERQYALDVERLGELKRSNEAGEKQRVLLEMMGQRFAREQQERGFQDKALDRAQEARLGEAELATRERVAGMRQKGDITEDLARAKVLSDFEEAQKAPGQTIDLAAPGAQAQLRQRADVARLQEEIFGKEPRLDPNFYRDLSNESSGWRGTPGTDRRDALIATLARLKDAGLTADQESAALEALRNARIDPGPYEPIGPIQGWRAIMSDMGGHPGDTAELEDRLLGLIGHQGGGPTTVPTPAEQAAMDAFVKRRKLQAPAR